jgi:hypothetical protein
MSDKVVKVTMSYLHLLTFPPLPRPDIFDSEDELRCYELRPLRGVVMVV